VPLIVHVPGAAPRRVGVPVSLIDVLPSVVGLLDGSEPGGWRDFLEQASGRDVLADGARARPVVSQRADRREPEFSLVASGWKLLHRPSSGDALFDWGADPWEINDASAAEPARAAEMRAALQVLVQADERRREARDGGQAPPPREMDPALIEKLKALGYAE
jgi:arylsulfatase A-like enzyme